MSKTTSIAENETYMVNDMEVQLFYFGKYVFNFATYQLLRDENSFELTDLERRFLLKLLQNVNQYVSREDLSQDDNFKHVNADSVYYSIVIAKFRQIFIYDEKIAIISNNQLGFKLVIDGYNY